MKLDINKVIYAAKEEISGLKVVYILRKAAHSLSDGNADDTYTKDKINHANTVYFNACSLLQNKLKTHNMPETQIIQTIAIIENGFANEKDGINKYL